jgi:signal transduction histidine kinase/ActR/RegA family two-component response regulator
MSSSSAAGRAAERGDDARAERRWLDALADAVVVVGRGRPCIGGNEKGRALLNDAALAAELRAVADGIAAGQAADERALFAGARSFLCRGTLLADGEVVLQIRDITAEKDGEVRRLQAEKLASIGLLAAGVAHEINNPTAFVLANLDSLLGMLRSLEELARRDPGHGPASGAVRLRVQEVAFEATAVVQESKEGMARIHRIVRDLGSFSHEDDQPSVTDVNAVAESALGVLRNEIKHRAVVERELCATRAVLVNPARLGQVFLNLALNALQALKGRDQRSNKLVVRSFDEGESVVFEVEDNGTGIGPEVLPRIFDSFFTTKPAGVGTGLGLPISRRIVRSFGGEIEVKTRIGEGSTFRVLLPGTDAATSGGRPPIELSPIYPRRQVLAIDDEALLLKAYRRMLGGHHDLTFALSAAEALQLLERQRGFEVILCDLQMPDMSGVEFYELLSARSPALAARVIFVTGGAFSTEARRFLEGTPVPRVQKPFRLPEILSAIDRRARESDEGRSSDVASHRDAPRIRR